MEEFLGNKIQEIISNLSIIGNIPKDKFILYDNDKDQHFWLYVEDTISNVRWIKKLYPYYVITKYNYISIQIPYHDAPNGQ